MSGPALLALEDGVVLEGRALGAPGTVTGEVCFNTGMTGYEEILTDPSYHGQIVALTAPHVGNTGINGDDAQAARPWVAGLAVRDAAREPSSWRARGTLDDFLSRHGVPGISELDTRRLTRHVRTRGAMRAALSSEVLDPSELVDVARAAPSLVGRDLVREVTTARPYGHGRDDAVRRPFGPPVRLGVPALRVAAFDFGVKRALLDSLAAEGFDVTVVPASTPAAAILGGGYDGVFLSNGPGDPEPVTYAVDTIAALLGRVPVFGVCLGHQLLALALGARTFKLPFGHRGSNHPVRRVGEARVEITAQNHGFAVDEASLGPTAARLTHVNLNDGTVEGVEVPGVAFSVQFHPEAGPGPHDARGLFAEFRDFVHRFEPAGAPLGAGA
ncbi:MAG TPA: glutamine-hydrolyzing carbamoyl-phosphate synthase small subunit [Actinomycetota bacterium]|nr:glutamine-hydrolyzing carbamoyl-phosphate synthase small subunit [Actinomycetota bacterium]